MSRLLYKRGDRRDLANWRPISLLNADYKIITKALANRLKLVLPNIIHENQSCCILRRSISDGCTAIRDAIYLCETTNTPAAVVSLDQMKAFDRKIWDYMTAVLTKFGFGPIFLSWAKALYYNVGSHLIVNNRLTSRIPLGRGVRQGCPFSPMLYVLCAEPLAAAIRNKSDIAGIIIPDSLQCLKVSSYADDTTCFLTSDSSFVALDVTLDLYQSASGSLLNRSKTRGLWLRPPVPPV